MNVVVFKDGKSGLNCEHAWADAPVAAHLFEISMIVGEWEMNPYDADNGECAAPLALLVLPAFQLLLRF